VRCGNGGMFTNGVVNSDFEKAGDFLKIYKIMNGTRPEDRDIVYLGIYNYE
jgi:hypothetical protein